MKCIIIDDDPIAIKILQGFISQIENLELVDKFEDPANGLNYLLNNKIDFVFLDIDMPVINGIEIIKTMGDQMPSVIFTTSHKEFAIESHQYNVSGYLVKPFSFADFAAAINKIKKTKTEHLPINIENTNFLFVKKNGVIKKIEKTEILYIECIGDYANIHTKDGKYTIHSTIKNMEETLQEKDFLRVHRSYIIRIDQIEEIENDAICINDKQIAIGKTYKQSVYKRLNILS